MTDYSRIGPATPRGATLDLNLRTRTAMVGGVGRTPTKLPLASLLQFTRPGPAAHFGEGGRLVTKAADVPRYSSHPLTNRQRGLLIEAAASNLLYPSNDFGGSAWQRTTGLTVFGAGSPGLSGLPGASRIVDPSGGPGLLSRTVNISTAAQALTASAYVRMPRDATGAARYVQANVYLTGGSGAIAGTVVYDLLLGTILSTAGSAFYDVRPGPDDLWRISVGTYNTNGCNQCTVGFQRWVSDTGNGYDLTAAQLEYGEAATSYIETTTAEGARAADRATINLDPAWFNPNEFTLYAEATVSGGIGGDQQIVGLRDDGFSNFVGIGKSRFGPSISAGTPSNGMTLYGAAPGSLVRVLLRAQQDRFTALKRGGGADYLSAGIVSGTGAVPQGLKYLELGHIAGGSQLSGFLHRVVIWPRALPDRDLTTLIA